MEFKRFIEDTETRYKQYVRDLQEACSKQDYTMKTIGAVLGGKYEIYMITANPEAPVTVLFTGGVHGDEPAGPHSILEFLRRGKMPDHVRILTIPLANPLGFEHGVHTATGRVNLNRQFGGDPPKHESKLIQQALAREDMSFLHSLHEDKEANGFYMYYGDESLRPHCKEILRIAENFMPLESRREIYGDKVQEKGLVFVDPAKRTRDEYNNLEDWIFSRGSNYICTETPSHTPMPKRVDCENAIMQYILRKLV